MGNPGLDDNAAAFSELLQFVYLTPVGIVKFGADGSIDLINPAAAQLLLPLLPEGRLTNIYDSLMPLAPDLRQYVSAFSRNVGPILSHHLLEMRAGSKILALSLTVQRISATVFMAVLEDVSGLVEQDRRLTIDRQRFGAIFGNLRDYAIYTITPDGRIEEWNQSLKRFGGWEAADVEGHSIELFFPSDDPGAPSPYDLLARAKQAGSVETEGWSLTRDGSRLWASTIFTALPDETGAVSGFVVVARDMTERKRIEDDLKKLATTDPLTGAFNRRQGQACLSAEFERRARSRQPFAVLMLDIDHFKSINDRYGHEAGDLVLCALVSASKLRLRVLDTLVRWGGEEFLIVLPGTNAEGAIVAAERLREAVAALRVSVDGGTVAFSVSIGGAIPLDDDTASLLGRADEALFAAKSRGRNQVVFAA